MNGIWIKYIQKYVSEMERSIELRILGVKLMGLSMGTSMGYLGYWLEIMARTKMDYLLSLSLGCMSLLWES